MCVFWAVLVKTVRNHLGQRLLVHLNMEHPILPIIAMLNLYLGECYGQYALMLQRFCFAPQHVFLFLGLRMGKLFCCEISLILPRVSAYFANASLD